MQHVLSKTEDLPKLDCSEVLDDTDNLDAGREPPKLPLCMLPSQLSSSLPLCADAIVLSGFSNMSQLPGQYMA